MCGCFEILEIESGPGWDGSLDLAKMGWTQWCSLTRNFKRVRGHELQKLSQEFGIFQSVSLAVFYFLPKSEKANSNRGGDMAQWPPLKYVPRWTGLGWLLLGSLVPVHK